ncbi:uncharacterized protein L201_004097 [Kwoniella dendrophila CBS 6074]|uniref:GAR domain-containing protein n=1 Tax=Kwoniella dendrophila CBS 6074 TaxID=1295534 RepID=A0AAX4JWB8_9TREE
MLFHSEEALQDLSADEAQELRDFLEKRRWFEAKLKLLEDVEPVYPFIHCTLEVAAACDDHRTPFIRAGESSSLWRLPTTDQVKQWQNDRDSLEEEVLKFDGGDLGRIKEKTRAATLLPLTPPSTHLVSITLDLIVLIDRLLKLLRHRGELLEMVLTRLHWDEIRWDVMKEIHQIRGEVAELVKDKASWKPSTGLQESNLRKPRRLRSAMQREDALALHTPPRTAHNVDDPTSSLTSPKLSTAQPVSPSIGFTTSSPGQSKSPRMQSTPKRALYIPLLHSQVVNLGIRHKNLLVNQVKRSGTLLDKMIDLAGPLKGLGDSDGPPDSQGKLQGSAVPEEMLDIQDAVEETVKNLGDQIAWCKRLESHWELSETHFNASVDTIHLAKQLQETLQGIVLQPITNELHSDLKKSLQAARTYLPEPIDQHFPSPSHPAYPDNDRHNAEVLIALTSARDQARNALQICQLGADWYGKLALAKEAMTDLRQQATTNLGALKQTFNSLSDLDANSSSLSNLEIAMLSDGSWLDDVDSKLSEAQKQKETGLVVATKYSLSILKFQNLLASPPINLQFSITDVDNLIPESKAVFEELEDRCGRTCELIEVIKINQAVFSLLYPLDASIKVNGIDLQHLEADIIAGIRQSSWPSSDMVDVTRFSNKLEEIESDIAKKVTQKLPPLYSTINEPRFSELRKSLQEWIDMVVNKGNHLHKMIDLLRRVYRQTQAVHKVDQDKISWLRRLRDIKQNVDGLEADALSTQIENMELEYQTWESTLVERIPFLADVAQQVMPLTDTSSTSTTGVTSTDSTLNYHPSTTSRLNERIIDEVFDSECVDRVVRNHINDIAMEIAALIADCKCSHLRSIHEQWKNRCHTAMEHLNGIISEYRHFQSESIQRITALETSLNTCQQSAKATEAIETAARDLSRALNSPLIAYERDSQAALEVLERSVEERPLATTSDIDPSSLSVDAARSSVVSLFSDVENVKRKLDTLVCKSTSKRKDEVQDKLPSGDVFGPLPSHEQAVLDASVDASDCKLQETVEQIDLRSSTSPSNEYTDGTPRSQILLTVAIPEATATTLQLQRVETLPDHEDTAHAIAIDRQSAPQNRQLADFDSSVKQCDAAFSDLLEAIDDGDLEQIQLTMNIATSVQQNVIKSSNDAGEVKQVAIEVDRIVRAWDDLRGLAEERIRSAEEADSDSRSPSVMSTIPAINSSRARTISRLPRLTSSIPRPINRATSNPNTEVSTLSPTLTAIQSSGSRIRAASDTPTRYSLSSRKNGSSVYNDGTNMTPSTDSSTWPRQSSLPRPSRSSLSGKLNGSTQVVPSRMRKSLSRTWKKQYVADTRSTLDIAVGQIVHVPVRPVGLNSADEWKDQSGQYWIGAEGRAKLCFCRILRSRTVMVRVGGGWVELSKFLLDHFAEAVGAWQKPFNGSISVGSPSIRPALSTSSSSSSLLNPKLPFPTTSASLSYTGRPLPPSQSSSSLASIASSKSDRTPISRVVDLPNVHQDYLSPEKAPKANTSYKLVSRPHTPQPAQSLNQTSPSGTGSPLSAFQFMRRASENPSVREKEKERFHGKRSILGKESSSTETE